MKVKYKIIKSASEEFFITFAIGVQTFCLKGVDDKKTAMWYKRQLKTAFKKLMKEDQDGVI